jgi:hypothetical protein
MTNALTPIEALVDKTRSFGEEWLPHPYFNRIACSNKGRVASIRTGKVLATHESNGYVKVSFRDEKLKLIRFTHRLAAETFIGISTLQVNHINGNKKDNRIENLEFVTPKQNTHHSIVTGLRTNQSVRTINAAFNEDAIKRIADLYHSGVSGQKISEIMGTGPTAIYYLIGGKTYREFSYLFKKSTNEAV